MVPEPKNEREERTAGHQRTQWTGAFARQPESTENKWNVQLISTYNSKKKEKKEKKMILKIIYVY